MTATTPIAHARPGHWLLAAAAIAPWGGLRRPVANHSPWLRPVASYKAWAMVWMLACTQAWPQTAPTPATPAVASIDQCKKDVFEFERAIGTVRQLQGNQAAADLKEKLLPAATERQLLTTEGYCGLAKHLHEKKLLR